MLVKSHRILYFILFYSRLQFSVFIYINFITIKYKEINEFLYFPEPQPTKNLPPQAFSLPTLQIKQFSITRESHEQINLSLIIWC